MHIRFRLPLALLIGFSAALPTLAATIINGREIGSIEREKLLAAQKETSALVQTQITELRESNSLLKQDLTQRIRTIQLLHDQIAELKKANELKQKELDGHKYDGVKQFVWILVTIVLTFLVTMLCEYLWAKRKKREERREKREERREKRGEKMSRSRLLCAFIGIALIAGCANRNTKEGHTVAPATRPVLEPRLGPISEADPKTQKRYVTALGEYRRKLKSELQQVSASLKTADAEEKKALSERRVALEMLLDAIEPVYQRWQRLVEPTP